LHFLGNKLYFKPYNRADASSFLFLNVSLYASSLYSDGFQTPTLTDSSANVPL
jgi:hypothetical protein